MRVLAPHPSALLRAPPGLRCGECVSMATDGRLPKDSRPTLSIDDLLSLSLDEGPALELDGPSRDRVAAYLRALLAYNEHTNVYSKSAYTHLPFHVHDSITLGMLIAELATPNSAVLDMGSGSGLPDSNPLLPDVAHPLFPTCQNLIRLLLRLGAPFAADRGDGAACAGVCNRVQIAQDALPGRRSSGDGATAVHTRQCPP